MPHCTRPECQTTAGCKCTTAARPPIYSGRSSLADFTDEEIAREYHQRALRKLGDQKVGVTGRGLFSA